MYLSYRFIRFLVAAGILTAVGNLWPIFYFIGGISIAVLLVAFLIDLLSVYTGDAWVTCERAVQKQFNNGEENTVKLKLLSTYKRNVRVEIIDELPIEFQVRDFKLFADLKPQQEKVVTYEVCPKKRGEYTFGDIRLYVFSIWGLVQRHFRVKSESVIRAVPSYSLIHNMELLSVENKTRECGIKRVRRIGSSTEFDQIKEYVPGDDYRTINWKASARKNQLMCNLYTDEQSQQVFNVLDKGRGMQHTFNRLSLLDYAINASLALSYMTIQHSDKAGLISFERSVETYVPANRQPTQMEILMTHLYKEQATFLQSDYSSLYETIKRKVNKRSLFVIYTTFDSAVSMERQLPYLRKISNSHLVLVVFFKDKEMRDMAQKRMNSEEEYFEHVVAENIEFEKRMIVQKLQRYGIQALLTEPENLTVNVINRYLEMKARRSL